MATLVSIHCITYNHVKFIRKALDGFLMQKTNFEYNIVVHDDASTDGTSDIIIEYFDKYPTKLVPIIQKENQYKKVGFNGIFKTMLPYLEGKYIAFCEGDDYWTDPYKLQKQVDLLEQNPNANLVHTGFDLVDENENEIDRPYIRSFMDKSRSGDVFCQLIKNNYIMTPTTLIRRCVYESKLFLKSPIIDYSISLAAAATGDVLYIPDHTSSYRKNHEGFIVSQQKKVNITLSNVRDYYLLEFLLGNIKSQSFTKAYYLYKSLLKSAIYKYRKGEKLLFQTYLAKKPVIVATLLGICFVGLLIDKIRIINYLHFNQIHNEK